MMMRIPHQVIVKSPGLLPMYYKLSELSEELNVPYSTLRDWLKKGVPFEQDDRQQIWVNGEEFAQWVEVQRQRKKKRKHKLQDNCAYCLRCKKDVELVNPIVIPKTGKLVLIRGKCPECGSTINRGGCNGKSN